MKSAPGDKARQRYLTSGVAVGECSSLRRYNPLAESGLFRTFADVEPSETAVLAFANTYGLLGGEITQQTCLERGGKMLLAAGETLDAWTNEIQQMAGLVTLWELAKSDSAAVRAKLGDVIKWHDHAVEYTTLRVRAWIATESHEPEMLARFVPGDLVGPALHYMQRAINKKLLTHAVAARMLWDSRYTRLSLHLVPTSLVGCLWLQFARAVDGDRDYRRCPDCRKWFEITKHISRSDRTFCSPTCKASAHRKKIAAARRLHADGVSAKTIAGQLKTDVGTVRGWISK